MKSQDQYIDIEGFYNMFNLEWYRIFLITAKTGNLTKAAQELYITQPSVSYAIKQMEEALGLKLFTRRSKGVELTAEGKALLGYVEPSFQLLDAGEKKLHNLLHLAAGEIAIGASDSVFKHVLLSYLDTYRLLHPEIRIRLSHGKSPDIVQRLKEGGIDCGIIPQLTSNDPQLHFQPLSTIQDCFVVGAAYRELAVSPLSAEAIRGLPLLLLSSGSSSRRWVDQWFISQGMSIQPDMELGSIDLLVELASRGFGVAFVTRSYVAEELSSGKLLELQLSEPIPPRVLGIVTRRDMPLSLAASAFVDMLASHYD